MTNQSLNRIRGTVACSFPQRPDSEGQSAGLKGSMDSPFDFVWKMKRQQELLAQRYDKWGEIDLEQDNQERWSFMTTPTGRWADYLHPGGGTQAFVPSLGLQIGFAEINAAAQGITPISDTAFWNLDETYDAGLDCVGFAQRAAGYRNNPYAWVELPPGIMEAGTTDYEQVLAGHGGSTYRVYPIEENGSNYGTTIVGRIRMIANADGTALVPSNAAMPSIEDLRKVLPGDIGVKDSTLNDPSDYANGLDGDPQSPWPNNHIAVIASVPTDPTITDPAEFMKKMILLEGEFAGKVQSAIKKLSINDYNMNNVGTTTPVYTSFSLATQILGTSGLDCQSWAIRRLR